MSEPAPEPTPTPVPPTPEPEPKQPPRDYEKELKSAQAALEAERRQHANARGQIDKLKASAMSDAEKAVAAAKAEGKSEALREAGARLAAAEFRARAAGRLADPAAAVELLDFTRFVGEDGEPDADRIEEAVTRLTAAAGAANGKHVPPPAPKVPSGVRETADETDWLRAAITGNR